MITKRQHELVQLIWAGHDTKAMAQVMGISPRTVEKHRQDVYRALRVRNTAQALKAALDLGLITHRQDPAHIVRVRNVR